MAVTGSTISFFTGASLIDTEGSSFSTVSSAGTASGACFFDANNRSKNDFSDYFFDVFFGRCFGSVFLLFLITFGFHFGNLGETFARPFFCFLAGGFGIPPPPRTARRHGGGVPSELFFFGSPFFWEKIFSPVIPKWELKYFLVYF